MEDLSRKITELLSNPETMEQIKGLTGLLGQSDFSAQNQNNAPKPPLPPSKPTNDFLNPEMLTAVMKFAPLLRSVNQEDDSTRLLKALKPFLRDERKKKVDEAIKLLGLMKMLPLLKDSGFKLF